MAPVVLFEAPQIWNSNSDVFLTYLKFKLEFECFLSRPRLGQMQNFLYFLPSLTFPIIVLSNTQTKIHGLWGQECCMVMQKIRWIMPFMDVRRRDWLFVVSEFVRWRKDLTVTWTSSFLLIIFVNFFFDCKLYVVVCFWGKINFAFNSVLSWEVLASGKGYLWRNETYCSVWATLDRTLLN